MGDKARATFMLEVETAERMRDLVYAEPEWTMSRLAQVAIDEKLARLEKKGVKIVPRKGAIKSGRPVR